MPNKKGFASSDSPIPTETTSENSHALEQEEPTEVLAPPPPELPKPIEQMWVGGTVVLTEENREAIKAAYEALWHSGKPTYLLQAFPEGDLLIAINQKAIALFGATSPDVTVPRLINNDFSPERDLTSDRTANEFNYQGTFKGFDRIPRTVAEIHRKIAENLWLVTVTSG